MRSASSTRNGMPASTGVLNKILLVAGPMLYQPKVFISHSAKESEAAALCHTLAVRLAQDGFEVLWDSNLQTSQAWRAVIDEWIWRCDAAVLVLSESATQSRYLAYEAALLRQRWRYRFPLIPVWCPGVTETV